MSGFVPDLSNAADIPPDLDIAFSFGDVTSGFPSVVAPDSYQFSVGGGASAPAPGSGGVFGDDEILDFSLSGGFVQPGSNAFTAPLTITLTNSSADRAFDVAFDLSYLVTLSTTGFGFSSMAVRLDGDPDPLDTLAASFAGNQSSGLFDLTDFPQTISVVPGQASFTLSLVANQTNTFPTDTAQYAVEAQIGIESIGSRIVDVPLPSTLSLLAAGMIVVAGARTRRR